MFMQRVYAVNILAKALGRSTNSENISGEELAKFTACININVCNSVEVKTSCTV